MKSKQTRGLLGNVRAQASRRPHSLGAIDDVSQCFPRGVEGERQGGVKLRAAIF